MTLASITIPSSIDGGFLILHRPYGTLLRVIYEEDVGGWSTKFVKGTSWGGCLEVYKGKRPTVFWAIYLRLCFGFHNLYNQILRKNPN